MIGHCSSFVVVISLVEDAPECESRGIDFEFVLFGGIWMPEDWFGGNSHDEFIQRLCAFFGPDERGSFLGEVV
jgi:hypothetical protein